MSKSNPTEKSFVISKQLVWEAYQRVRANKGAPGADEVSVAAFESDLKNNLYKIWNRMSSGTYFPPPVRSVEIPKPHGGGSRMLGCRRSRQSAARLGGSLDPVLIVHPFHVLAGRRLPVLFAKRRGREVVFVCEGGPVGRVTVPESWTDRAPTPVGHRLSVEALVELDTLVRLLGQR